MSVWKMSDQLTNLATPVLPITPDIFQEKTFIKLSCSENTQLGAFERVLEAFFQLRLFGCADMENPQNTVLILWLSRDVIWHKHGYSENSSITFSFVVTIVQHLYI